MKELLTTLLTVIVVTTGLMIVPCTGLVYLIKSDCTTYSEVTGRHTELVFLECYVTADDGTVYTREEYKMIIATKEAK